MKERGKTLLTTYWWPIYLLTAPRYRLMNECDSNTLSSSFSVFCFSFQLIQLGYPWCHLQAGSFRFLFSVLCVRACVCVCVCVAKRTYCQMKVWHVTRLQWLSFSLALLSTCMFLYIDRRHASNIFRRINSASNRAARKNKCADAVKSLYKTSCCIYKTSWMLCLWGRSLVHGMMGS